MLGCAALCGEEINQKVQNIYCDLVSLSLSHQAGLNSKERVGFGVGFVLFFVFFFPLANNGF